MEEINNDESNNKIEIEVKYLKDLTPDSDANKENYIKVLNWAVEKKNNQIKNVALTGSYGSGKSSILKSFINQHVMNNSQSEENTKGIFKKKSKPNLNNMNDILEISVASFNSEYKKNIQEQDEANNSENSGGKPSIENILEQYIMQQMFYRVSKDKIPLSRFSRIENIKSDSLNIISIILSLLTVFLFIRYEWVDYFIKDLLLNFNHKNLLLYIQLILYLCGFGILFLGLIAIIELFKDFKINRVEVGGTAIELSPEESHSVFNRYIDEILYFFSCTNFRIVIFEDLDRFESLEIFERLRDLNILLNNNEELKERNIVFIYALSDDIFSDEDNIEEVQNRTKFFDLIIPTVKVANVSNSEDILIDLLKDKIHSIESSLIQGISLYINDMRILINICNEFHIMKAALNNRYLEDSNIFAMAVYKNLYPKDYTSLLSNKGLLLKIFEQKNNLVKEISKETEQKSNNIKKYLHNIDNEIANTVEELHFLFLKRKKYEDFQNIQINCGSNKIFDIKNLESFKEAMIYLSENREELEGTNIEINNYQQPYYRNNTIIESFKEFVSNDGEFEDITRSYNSVKMKQEQGQKEALKEIHQYEKELNFINSYSIKELYKRHKSEMDSLLSETLKDKDLLKYLITAGWIKENYNEYITYYYGEVLPPEDIEYIKTFYGSNSKEKDYKLTNIPLILKKVSGELIQRDEIYNFYLLRYIFLNDITDNDVEVKKQLIIEYIDENIEKTIDFTNLYMDYSEERDFIITVFRELKKSLTKLWNVVEEKSDFEKQKIYVQIILETYNENQLIELDSSKSLSSFISKTPLFLKWFLEPNAENADWSIIFKKLNVCIEDLGTVNVDTQHLLDKIIKNQLYSFNKKNIVNILGDSTEFTYKATQIYNRSLASKVNNEINEFANMMLLQEHIIEEEEYFISLLNNEELEIETKNHLIQKWQGNISTTNKLNEQWVIDSIMKNRKLSPTWNNIFGYLDSKEIENIEDGIINFIIDNCIILKEEYVSLSFTDKQLIQLEKLSNKTLENNEISESDIEKLFFYLSSNTIQIANITETRVKTLIKLKLLNFSTNDYEYMQNNHFNEKTLAVYLKTFADSNIEILNNVVLDSKPLKILLEIVDVSIIKDVLNIGVNQQFTEVDFTMIEIVLNRNYSNHIPNQDILLDVLNHDNIHDDVKLKLIYQHKRFNLMLGQETSVVINSLLLKGEVEKLVKTVLNSENVDNLVKINMLKAYVNGFEILEDKIIDLCVKYYIDLESIELEREEFFQLISHSNNEQSVATLLILGIDQFNIDGIEYERLVGELKTNHKLLSNKGERGKKLSRTKENEKLMNILKEKHYISSSNYEEEVIKFNVSRNFE